VPIVVLGNLLYNCGVVFFILPSGLITGGTTGIAIILNRLAGIPIEVFVAIFNLLMFLAGYAVLGKTFAMTTLVSSVASPLTLTLLQRLAGSYTLTEDLLLCAIFGGLCIGTAIAMILKLDASTGGMDIPPLLLKKWFGIPVSVSIYAFDCLILIGQMFFVPIHNALYGIVLVMVYSITLDKMLAIGDKKLQLEIVSFHHEEIEQAILSDLDRGITLLHGQTGYLRKETDVIICVIAPRERHKIERLIHRIDPHAFVILSQVNRVSGRGFTEKKRYLERIQEP